jgi:hypothetical protein
LELTGHVTRNIHKQHTEHELAELQKAIAVLPAL